MKTISDHAIYCTEEQTKKALELGAPLQRYTSIPNFADVIEITTFEYYEIPTTNQMIGWLESQDAIMEVHVGRVSTESKTNNWDFAIFVRQDWDVILGEASNYYDRKAATLAAIDAALECLKTQNNKVIL